MTSAPADVPPEPSYPCPARTLKENTISVQHESSQHETPLLRTAVVLDPHPVYQEGLRRVLRPIGVDVVGAAPTAASALAFLDEREPDLFVAEIDGVGGPEEGIRCLHLARRHHPTLAMVVLSSRTESSLVQASLAAGAVAYVPKTACLADVVAAARRAVSPSIYLVSDGNGNGAVASAHENAGRTALVLTPAGHVTRLTRRELEVLRLLEGRSNREVAKLLWVTDETVKFHLANVYRKLGVSNRVEAAAWARANGLFETASEPPHETVLPARIPAGGRVS